MQEDLLGIFHYKVRISETEDVAYRNVSRYQPTPSAILSLAYQTNLKASYLVPLDLLRMVRATEKEYRPILHQGPREAGRAPLEVNEFSESCGIVERTLGEKERKKVERREGGRKEGRAGKEGGMPTDLVLIETL